jgi:hypothetical protein
MRTLIILFAGFGLLSVFLAAAGKGPHKRGKAALFFIPLWLAAAGVNLAVGVLKAGYSVSDEFLIFLLIFAPPAVVGWIVWRRTQRI